MAGVLHTVVFACVAASDPPLHDSLSLLNTSLSQAWHDIFPQEMLDKLVEETDKLYPALHDGWTVDEATGKVDKTGSWLDEAGVYSTPSWWFSMEHDTGGGALRKPRCALEAAIRRLHDIDFPGGMHERIVGGEWWLRTHAYDEVAPVTFHFDKDEAHASANAAYTTAGYINSLVYPSVSTVNYLTNTGAPTLIMNMTLSHEQLAADGFCAELPKVPTEGHLVYPEQNKHVIFRGNLYHGVARLDQDKPRSGGKAAKTRRRTLLVNWWTKKPEGPNCFTVADGVLKEAGVYDPDGTHAMRVRLGLLTPGSTEAQGEGRSAVAAGETPPPRVSWREVDMGVAAGTRSAAKEGAAAERLMPVKVVNQGQLFVELPQPDATGGSNLAVKWTEGETSFGRVQTLDSETDNINSLVFGTTEVKAIVFANAQQWISLQPFVLPLTAQYRSRVIFMQADPKGAAADATEAFGFGADTSYPTFALHQTQSTFGSGKDAKFALSDNNFGQSKPTKRALARMIERYFEGALTNIAGEDQGAPPEDGQGGGEEAADESQETHPVEGRAGDEAGADEDEAHQAEEDFDAPSGELGGAPASSGKDEL